MQEYKLRNAGFGLVVNSKEWKTHTSRDAEIWEHSLYQELFRYRAPVTERYVTTLDAPRITKFCEPLIHPLNGNLKFQQQRIPFLQMCRQQWLAVKARETTTRQQWLAVKARETTTGGGGSAH
jgi:hypothetical protein